MKTRRERRSLAVISGFSAMLYGNTALAEWGLNMPQGVTEISNTVYDLHMLIFWICCAIGVVVFGAMFYSMYYHRKSRGHEPAQFHESTTLEITWTVIPFLILIGMAIPATKTLIAMEDTSNADLTIKITGYQWKWEYEYLDDNIQFFSNMSTTTEEIENSVAKDENYLLDVDNPVVIPTNKKVRFLLTANDVIHAWWVPDLAVKKDAVPGFINEMWTKVDEPGVYRGQCAELCGKDHGFMPIVVVAMEEPDYLNWVEEQKAARQATLMSAERDWPMQDLMAKGEEVYNTNCAACHQASGEGIAGLFPAIKGSSYATGDVNKHIDIVMNGAAGTAMQAFAGQLDDVDMAAVLTYQRNAWGNNTGEAIQPLSIKALR